MHREARRRWLRWACPVVAVVGLILVVLSLRLDWWESMPVRHPEEFRFSDGFEDATTLADLCPHDGRRWHGWQRQPQPEASVTLSQERVHSGQQALKCVAPPAPRGSVAKADLQLGGLHFVQGDDVWFRGWFYLASDSAEHVFLWDLETSRKYQSPGRRLYVQSDQRLASDLGKWWRGPTFRPTPPVRGLFPRHRWVQIRLHLYLSVGADGRMSVWQDGEHVLEGQGSTLPTSKTVYDRLQVGITANGNPNQAQILYVDDVELSNRPLE